MQFQAENYRTQVGLNLDSDGSPHLDLFDDESKLRAALGVTALQVVRTGASEKTAPSSLTLFDKKGKVIWRSPKVRMLAFSLGMPNPKANDADRFLE